MSNVQGKSPLVQGKEPYGDLDWLLVHVGFHPATRSIQSTPVDNARKARVRQYNK